jgi:sortase (surface protein transpeptidase)
VGSGFFVCYQDGVARPKLSHLNCDGPWQIRASQAIVPLQPGTRSIRVYSSGGGHVVLDLVGYITGPNSGASATGLFVPAAAPQRRLDTRVVNGLGWMPEGWTVEASLPAGVSAAAAVWNLAVAQASVPGYLSMYPARTLRPKSAQICVQAIGQTSNSHSWSRVSSSGSAIYAASGGAVIADYAGYFVGTPAARTTSAVANRSPAIGPPYTLEIPRIGLSMPVDLGSSSIVDYGYGWIMPGSVNVGENGYVIVFAHRTTGAGPFRYLHYLDAGDEVTLVDGFGKRWVHRVNRTSITGSSNYSIINGVLASPTPGISLVACSKSNGTPTSLQYRIVVSAAREFIIVP